MMKVLAADPGGSLWLAHAGCVVFCPGKAFCQPQP